MTFPNNQEKKKTEAVSYQTDSGYPWEKSPTILATNKKKEEEIKDQVDKVFGQDLKWYAKIFGWPVIILIVAEIFLTVNVKRYLPLLAEEKVWEISLFLQWLVFAFMAIYALKRAKATFPQLIVSCLSGAFIAGIILSIFQLFWYSGLWTIFNIIGLPLLMIFESCIIAVIIYGFFKLIK